MTAPQTLSSGAGVVATPSPFNPLTHPVIANNLVSIGARDTLHALRGVSHAYRDMCDAALVRNLVLEVKPSELGRLEATAFACAKEEKPPYIGAYFEDFESQTCMVAFCPKVKIAALSQLQEFTESSKIPAHARRVLGFVRNLDILWSTSIQPKRGRSDNARRSVIAVFTAVSSFMTNIDTIRYTQDRDFCWPSELPFAARRLILCGYVLENYDKFTSFLPKFPIFGDIPELVIMVTGRNCKDKGMPTLPSYPACVRSVVLAMKDSMLHDRDAEYCVPVILRGAVDFRYLIETSTELHVAVVDDGDNEKLEWLRTWLPTKLPSLMKFLDLTEEEVSQLRYNVKLATELVPKFGDSGIAALRGEAISPIDVDFHLNQRVDPAFFTSLSNLENALLKHTHPFTTSGSVEIRNPLSLYFTDQKGNIQRMGLPLGDEDVAQLHAAGSPSPFGRGQELVYDESYRSAREIMPPNFSLSGDVLADGAVLGKIERAMSAGKLSAVLSKMNIYAEGGFFKPHRDTPRGDNHLGTLTLCLPSAFTGGELVVKHAGVTKVSDWAGAKDVSWTFLYSDCEHEVLPVTSGMRVTIAYDIFVAEEPQAVVASVSDTFAGGTLHTLLADPFFMPLGGVLAFGLQHEYPSADRRDIDLRAMLKGSDAIWADALDAGGINYEILAVYRRVDPDFARQQETYKNRRLAVSRDFNAFNGGDTYNAENPPFAQVPVKNIHWVTTPGAWGVQHAYATYGNAPGAELMYISVAIYAYVGPSGDRSSFDATTFKGLKRDLRDEDDDGHDSDRHDSDGHDSDGHDSDRHDSNGHDSD